MKFVQMFVALTEEERITLDKKYKDDTELKAFLNMALNKSILLECNAIQLNEPASSEEEKEMTA